MLRAQFGSMEKQKRAELIRERLRAKAGKWQFAGSGKPTATVQLENKESRISLQSWGLALSFRWGRTQWLETPDKKPSVAPKPKRNEKEHALTKIAAREPYKLRRRYTNAEAILSERARR